MHPGTLNFKRKFSVNFRRDLKLELSRMSFSSDFLDLKRGNLYPPIELSDCSEELACGTYAVSATRMERVFCEFFPYASYEMKMRLSKGSCGLAFFNDDTRVEIMARKTKLGVEIECTEGTSQEFESVNVCCQDALDLVVCARPGFFDVNLLLDNGYYQYLTSFKVDSFSASNKESFFRNTKVTLVVCGEATVYSLSSYLDSGVGQADIRPVRYENGEVVRENGRMFFTVSIRMQAETYQGVFSWLPGTDEFKMEGALFFDIGNGVWNAEVASCLIYNRLDSRYHMWIRCAAAGHVLAYSSFASDVRFGVNVIDVKPMPPISDSDPEELFLGVRGDEDPEFIYDEKRGVWMMAVCRVERESKKYRYFFYESARPDSGFVFIGKGLPGAETGGNIVRMEDKYYFVCGNDFSRVSDYRVYEWGKFESYTSLNSDYPDGGFRGWGTVFSLNMGTRSRFFHFTFDRKLMSDFNWSYGNLYCFEAEEYIKI